MCTFEPRSHDCTAENKEIKLVITLNHTDSDGFITIVQGNQTRSPIFIFYTFIFAKKKFKFVHLSPIVTTTVLVQQKCGNPISDNAKQYRQ